MRSLPSNSLTVSGMLLSQISHELLLLHLRDCASISDDSGHLVKVIAPEHEGTDVPGEVAALIQMARSEGKDWLYITNERAALTDESYHFH